MRVKMRHLVAIGLGLGIALGMIPEAAAFYPAGEFITEVAGGTPSLRLIRWRTRDIINDGGIPITLQGGPTGWTAQERQLIREAFQAWENVPTSYAQFRFMPTIDAELPFGTDVGTADFINFVSKEGPGSAVAPPGVVATSFVTSIANSGLYTLQSGEVVQLTGPAILDVDIAIQEADIQLGDVMDFATGTNTPGAGPFPLRATTLQMVGFLLGLQENPSRNLQIEEVTTPAGDIEILVDPPVWARRTAVGDLELSGVTPVMSPFVGFMEHGPGVYRLHYESLAPSDIAGVTWLYPRTNLDNLFTLSHEGRTRAVTGIPSQPVPGALIQAWGNVDNNTNTARVPMFSTMTALYEHQEPFGGRFDLINMFKELETINGDRFAADYVITMSQLPEGNPETYNSTGTPIPFNVPYIDQVFREDGENIFNMARVDDGTPLRYDSARRQIVSLNTGRTLPQMLPGTRPMFGNAVSETVCPLNLVAATMAAPHGPELLRNLRDNVLLQSAVGVVLADGYYRAAPAISHILIEYPAAMTVARGALALFEWSVVQWRALGLLIAGAMIILFGLARNRRLARSAAVSLIVLGLFLAGAPAEAQIAPMSLEDMVAYSHEVLIGEVVSVESRWDDQGRIVTDIALVVEETVVGRTNRHATVYFSQLGGEKDGITTYVPQYPQWREGEDVLVFMSENHVFGLMAVGGRKGKMPIRQDRETGERFVVTGDMRSQSRPARPPQTTEKRFEEDQEVSDDENDDEAAVERHIPGIPLDELKDEVRQIAREQERVRR